MDCTWVIRKAVPDDAAGVAKVHVDSWRTTYKGILPDEYLSRLSYSKRKAQWRDRFMQNSLEYRMFVVEDSLGQIIGFADGGPERSDDPEYDGELYAIYLLQEHQRKGIGRHLFTHVVSHLSSINIDDLMVWVLDDNPCRHFYESLGGKLVRTKTNQIGNQILQESAYGWHGLSLLLAELRNE